MRHLLIAAVLAAGAASAGCAGTEERLPPPKALDPGVPADLPALGADAFAVVRLTVYG